jgi:F420-non-reducing hydrogenase small subunit
VAIVDLHEKLLGLVDEVEFVRIPVLMDEKGYPRADVGLVEGAVRTVHDRDALLQLRESVDTLVAFGSCAAYGGPSGIGWLHGRDTIMQTVYGSGLPTNATTAPPDDQAPALEDSVIPVDEVVDIDLYVPGCPPHPLFIATAIRRCLDPKTPPSTLKPVCADCSRAMRKQPGTPLRKGALTAADPELCLLSQGVVCLGSVSLNRCHAPCPQAGIACTGCAGPALDVLLEPQLDLRTMIAERMQRLCDIDPTEVCAYIEDNAKTFYAYALASPAVYGKPTVEMRRWAGGDHGGGHQHA